MSPIAPDRRIYSANISKYYFYTIFRGLNFGLLTATWVIYLQHLYGMNMTQVTLVDVAFWLAATLGEVPTGIVADRYGRKQSIAIGNGIMCLSLIAWTFAPSVPFIVASYVALALGVTFVSGADDALLFESTKASDRVGEYTMIVGRVAAISLAAAAAGNLASGLLATIDLRLPFACGALCMLITLAIVFTFREARYAEESVAHRRPSYRSILRESMVILRDNAPLRYAIFYLTLIPIAAMVIETVFLQPQALALGLPLAAIGAVTMALQFVKMAGSTVSHRIKSSIGDTWVIYVAPFLIAIALVFLGAIELLPALLFAAVISFVTAFMRPLIMFRIQSAVTDNIRATVLSLQSLLFAAVVAILEPAMGIIADRAGLAASYYALAAGLIILVLLLFAASRKYFP